jgi:hypothetical protein
MCVMIYLFVLIVAMLTPPFLLPTPAPLQTDAAPQPGLLRTNAVAGAPPTVYVSVKGDPKAASVPLTWDPRAKPSPLACPKRGDKTWNETINFPGIVVRFDCPVGVAYKTWEPSGKRVHIGIRRTTILHPGVLPVSGSVTYDLVAPE